MNCDLTLGYCLQPTLPLPSTATLGHQPEVLCSPSLPAAGLGTTLVIPTLIHLLTLLQQLQDWSDVVWEEVLGHKAVNGKPEANQDRHHLLQPAATVGGKLMPTAADELEVAEQVKEEAGLIGHQQVKQDVVLQVHRLQEDQESGVRVDTGVQLWLLSAAEWSKLTVSEAHLYSNQVKEYYFNNIQMYSRFEISWTFPQRTVRH